MKLRPSAIIGCGGATSVDFEKLLNAICNGEILRPDGLSKVVFQPVMKASVEELPWDPPEAKHITLTEFETLSLAARARLLNLGSKESPAVDSEIFRDTPAIDARLITEALIAAAERSQGAGYHAPRMSLHIIGAFIEGDVDLTGLNLPFSVRLTGCAIDGAVRAGRAQLVTLDLSGSAFRGLFASFIHTRGSVRMRRATSTSVVDFGGAKIDDVFDASDCVVFPLDDPPQQEAFVGDRGIFNLSLAELSNEMRMLRARIYGGLTLKGCRVNRSVFLDDAILRAPIAFLERLGIDVTHELAQKNHLHELTKEEKPPFEEAPIAAWVSWQAEDRLANELHCGPRDPVRKLWARPSAAELSHEEQRARMRVETLRDFNMPYQLSKRVKGRRQLLERLLTESTRASTTSLRADGLQITGSLFARNLRASGRIRCKYGKIQGGLHLDGVRVRSAEDVRDGLRAVRHLVWRNGRTGLHEDFVRFIDAHLGLFPPPDGCNATEISLFKREPAENLSFALDIRDTFVGGDVSLKPDQRGTSQFDKIDVPLREAVMNALRAPRLTQQQWEVLQNSEEKLQNPKEKWHVKNAYVVGELAFSGSKFEGDLNLEGVLANLINERTPSSKAADAGRPFLHIRQTEIGGSLRLRNAIGVSGVDARHAQIKAGVEFANHSVRNNTFGDCALALSGKLHFGGAEIGGDATFLFDAERGPSLLLPRAIVKGRLHILPALNSVDWKPQANDEKIPRSIRLPNFWRAISVFLGGLDNEENNDTATAKQKSILQRMLGRLAALQCAMREFFAVWFSGDPRDGIAKANNTAPEIDLRGARATEIGHPACAWPKDQRLQVEGFVYDHAAPFGPLSPAPGPQPPKEGYDNSRFWVWLGLSLLAGALLLVFLWQAGPLEGLTATAGMYSTLLAGVCLITYAVQRSIGAFSEPRQSRSIPRALAWLDLQIASQNPHRIKRCVVPLQPYVQAAKVLRSGGLILAANHVEHKRLELRREHLSMRIHWYVKLPLAVADFVTRYGFSPMRTLAFAAFACAVAGMFFHQADRVGHIRPIDGGLLQLIGSSPKQSAEERLFATGACRKRSKRADAACPCEPGSFRGSAACVRGLYPNFVSLLYAFDVMIPGLDLGQDSYWRPMTRHADGDELDEQAHRFEQLGLAIAPALLKVIGWLLATALAVSILTRFEAMVARNEE